MTIKSLQNSKKSLKGLHRVKRQKAIIYNNNLDKKIANIRIQKAQAHINIYELKDAKKALGTNSNIKLMQALHELANKSNN